MTNYEVLREKFKDDINPDDRVCGNCEFHNMSTTDNSKFSKFGICEYYMHNANKIENEDDLILTRQDRCCFVKENFDEDAFMAAPSLLDFYEDCEAQDKTDKWLNAHYYE